MDHVKLDFRFALRALARRPGFTAIAVITLALGIGANTAIFSVVNGVLLRSLPYLEPDRLALVWAHDVEEPSGRGSMSGPDIDDVRALDAVTAIEGYRPSTLTLNRSGSPELVPAARVTGGLLIVFGLRPVLGRDLTHEDDLEDAPRVVVVSHDFWETRLGGRPEAIGTMLELSERSYEVVGVAPAAFSFPVGGSFGSESVQLWTGHNRDREGCARGCRTFGAIAQLAPGVSVERASAELAALAATLSDEHPTSNSEKSLRFEPLDDFMVGDVRRPLWIVFGAVGFVLLIACANVANLLLVRASARRGEVAVRAALGASRRRLVAQVLVESLVLAFAGAALGLLLAVGGVEILKRLGPDAVPRIDEISLDATVLAFSFIVAIGVALLFGLSPALRMARTSLVENLRSETRGGQHPREGWTRALLLSAEIALSLVLLVGAGLLMRSLIKLYDIDLGFEGREVVRFELFLPEGRYKSLATSAAFYRTLEERISALPGVEAVGSAFGAPFKSEYTTNALRFDGRPVPAPGDEPYGWLRLVTPGYFDAMQLRLRRGRLLRSIDRAGTIRVAVVNEAFVRENLGGDEPIGERFSITVHRSMTWTIVGVVGDVRQSLKGASQPEVYVPHAQYVPGWPLTVHVRSRARAKSLLTAAREQVRALDPNLPLRNPETVTEAIRQDAAPTRFLLLLVALFAGLAVALATVGLYGVTSYLVSRRTREIGIRLALGASRVSITRLVLQHALWPALLGIVGGLLASIVVTGVMRSLLFEVEPIDPLVLSVVSVLLLAVAALASMLPARRAMRVNPTEALRSE
ncbi:MAG: ABC transporter permease [Longimicrobiales bacterium]